MTRLILRLLVAGGLLCGLAPFAAGQGITYYPPAATSSGGDVVGPASATDNAVCRWDGATGKLTQNSLAVLSDLGALSGLTGLSSTSVTDSGLTSGRVVLASTGGLLSDDADLTFATDTLIATKLTVATTLTSPNLAAPVGSAQAISATAPAATTGASQVGKAVTITASNAVASTDTAGAAAGGSVTITAGSAARNTSGNANGGDVVLSPGTGIGTGTAGAVVLPQGSAAKPALVFGLGLTTGLYLPVSNAMSLVTNGAEWLRLDNNTANFGARPVGFSAAFGTADAGLIRDAAGVVRVTAGASNTGALLFLLGVETVAATKTPAVTESAELYTNGADVDGQAITLTNDPTVGTCFEFALTSTDTSNSLAIAPAAGETLMDAATTCSTSFSATAKGATARICAVSGGSGGLWLVMSKNGTWTCS